MGLGRLSGGGFFSIAKVVSADGSEVVGYSDSASGDEPFIWDSTNGMQSLRDVLIGHGLDLTGWSPHSANGISANGMTMVGYGINPDGNTEAWLSNISVLSIDAILNFFDQSAGAGTIVGDGPGNSANGRLNPLRNMLEMAGDLIAIADIEGAGDQLNSALGKCNGELRPPDFVAGEAVEELHTMITEMMGEL